jgi:hypothetical protein
MYIFDGDQRLTGTPTSLLARILEQSTHDWLPSDQLVGAEVDPNTSDGNDLFDSSNWHTDGVIPVTASAQGYLITMSGTNLTANASSSAPFDTYSILVDDPDHGDIPDASMSVLMAAMKECYIEAVRDTNRDDNEVPFLKNVPNEYLQNTLGPTHRGSKYWEGPDYWSVYAILCYEGDVNMDFDPDLCETGLLGGTTIPEPEYSAVFYETISDDSRYQSGGQSPADRAAENLAHEIAHAFGAYVWPASHPQDGSLLDSLRDSRPSSIKYFNNDTIAIVRQVSYP